MPRYDIVDNRANVSELDPCLAAEIRLKQDRFCNWKVVCLVLAIVLLLLLIVVAVLFFTLPWSGTQIKDITAESPEVIEKTLELSTQTHPATTTTQPPTVQTSAYPPNTRAPSIQVQHHYVEVKTVPVQPIQVQPSTVQTSTQQTTTPVPSVQTQTHQSRTSTPPVQIHQIRVSTSGHRLPLPAKLESVDTFGKRFATCDEYLKHGFSQNGVYRLYSSTGYNFTAQCVMDEGDGKAWMIMQKRTNGELAFWNRDYHEYVEGFGTREGDHWLGLKQIRNLIEAGYKLQLKMEIKGDRCQKNKDDLYIGTWDFEIDSASKDYRLHVSQITSGNFTDPLTNIANSNGLPFNKVAAGSTNQGNCLERLHLGGWWSAENGCSFISLNGKYTCERSGSLFGLSVYANPTKNIRNSSKYIRPRSTRMMLHVCNGEKECA